MPLYLSSLLLAILFSLPTVVCAIVPTRRMAVGGRTRAERMADVRWLTWSNRFALLTAALLAVALVAICTEATFRTYS